MTLEDAAIPIGGRFQRIENALDRIEVKLDAKANLVDVISLDRRVATLELKSAADVAVDSALKSSQDNATRIKMAILGIIMSALLSAAGLLWNIIVHYAR